MSTELAYISIQAVSSGNRKERTGEAITHKLVNRIPELVVIINFVVDLMRDSCISSYESNFLVSSCRGLKINGDFNPKMFPQMRPQVESIGIIPNPQ